MRKKKLKISDLKTMPGGKHTRRRWDKPAPHGTIRYKTQVHDFECVACRWVDRDRKSEHGHRLDWILTKEEGWEVYWRGRPYEKWLCPECVEFYRFRDKKGWRREMEE